MRKMGRGKKRLMVTRKRRKTVKEKLALLWQSGREADRARGVVSGHHVHSIASSMHHQ
jgi:hypothetical protein